MPASPRGRPAHRAALAAGRCRGHGCQRRASSTPSSLGRSLPGRRPARKRIVPASRQAAAARASRLACATGPARVPAAVLLLYRGLLQLLRPHLCGVRLAVLAVGSSLRLLARYLTSGGGRHAAPCVGSSAWRPCGIRTSHTSLRYHSADQRLAAAEVSKSCSSFASSADTSPTSIRSSGLMNPSLMRKPPVRAIASRSGTAQ